MPQMPRHAKPADLVLANRLADAAGAAIRPLFRGTWSEERKADRSYVTEADRAAEAAMRAIRESDWFGLERTTVKVSPHPTGGLSL